MKFVILIYADLIQTGHVGVRSQPCRAHAVRTKLLAPANCRVEAAFPKDRRESAYAMASRRR